MREFLLLRIQNTASKESEKGVRKFLRGNCLFIFAVNKSDTM